MKYYYNIQGLLEYLYLLSPSSRGLGHRPFTAVTGVRIPVGTPIKDNSDYLSYCSLTTEKQAENERFSKGSLSS